MAKIFGINGAMTGKLGNTVMAVRNGEQIARQYQPVVANPSTPAQVEARAKLKLMSQLSAVMAPYIAMRKEGPVSSRNLFVKKNYGATTYTNNNADIDLSVVKLTSSVVAIPAITAVRDSNKFNIDLSVGISTVDRMVYVMFTRDDNNALRAVASTVVSEPGENSHFPTSISSVPGEAFFYGYGIRLNSEAARTIFGDMSLVSADDVARVITSRALLESDVTLTETRYTTVSA